MALGSMSKALGPVTGSVVLSWSINSGHRFPFDFHFVYIIIAVISVATSQLPLGPAAINCRKDESSSSIERQKENRSEVELTGSVRRPKYQPVGSLDISMGKVRHDLSPISSQHNMSLFM